MSWRSLDEVRIGRPLRLERHRDGVWCLVLTRAKARNALTAEMVSELGTALATLHALPSDELRVAVLEGEGDAFCAGADIAHMRARPLPIEAWATRGFWRPCSAVQLPCRCGCRSGAAVGGGLARRFVTSSSRPNGRCWRCPVRLGLPAVIDPTVRKLGVGHTATLAFTGRLTARQSDGAAGAPGRGAETFDRAIADAVGELLLPDQAAREQGAALTLALLPF